MTRQDRYRGALLGLAAGDALGTTLEFKRPGTFAPITDMVGGGPFDLRPGEWTDDTSMALCLAESLVECDGFDPVDQLQRYLRWWHEGHHSSTGRCFDIGYTVPRRARAVRAYGRAVVREHRPADGRQRLADAPRTRAALLRQRSAPGDRTRRGQLAHDARRAGSGRRLPLLRRADRRRAWTAARRAICSRPGSRRSTGSGTTQPLAPAIAEVANGSFRDREPPEIAAPATSSARSRRRCGRSRRARRSRTARCWPSTWATTRTRPARSTASLPGRTTASRGSRRAGGRSWPDGTRWSGWRMRCRVGRVSGECHAANSRAARHGQGANARRASARTSRCCRLRVHPSPAPGSSRRRGRRSHQLQRLHCAALHLDNGRRTAR